MSIDSRVLLFPISHPQIDQIRSQLAAWGIMENNFIASSWRLYGVGTHILHKYLFVKCMVDYMMLFGNETHQFALKVLLRIVFWSGCAFKIGSNIRNF